MHKSLIHLKKKIFHCDSNPEPSVYELESTTTKPPDWIAKGKRGL